MVSWYDGVGVEVETKVDVAIAAGGIDIGLRR